MKVTFDTTFLSKTVPSTYSWDDGPPSLDSPNLISLTKDSDGYYIGYAPFVVSRLSSVPIFEEQDGNIYTVFRRINFNDYYNCSSNALTSLGFDEEYYCHIYVMPGVYTPTAFYSIYNIALAPSSPATIYNQPHIFDTEQQAPILELVDETSRGTIRWKWGKISCDYTPFCDTGERDKTISTISWRDSKCSEYFNKTWDNSKDENECFEAAPVLDPLPSGDEDNPYGFFDRNTKIKIIEIPPTALLSASNVCEDMITPHTGILTPRFTKCGSFPIEKIVWDLGDGSPLLVQRRWNPNASSPFIYTGAITNDPLDPRNYDLQYTYSLDKSLQYTYYPSITAYAQSTNTSDCASIGIGPIQPKPPQEDTTIHLLQTSINENKDVTSLLQVGEDIVAVKFEMPT
jgi:hypothetical protein